MQRPVPPSAATGIAFIGFGELGRRFARDLAGRHGLRLSAYDVKLDQAATRESIVVPAREIGVAVFDEPRLAAAGADIVISAVTADQTEAVARRAAGLLQAGQILLDVNSASPGTKRRAAEIVHASGADYVEGAVMGAVQGPGITVEILAGGPAAARAAAALNPLGMSLTPVATEIGRASAIKLCRSIMIKGLEALAVDCARATKHWGVEADVYASLARTFPSIDWPTLAEDLAERVATHGVRRAAEMREAADMLAEMGLDPSLARAVAEAQARGAKPKV